ncbi:hypothetical protein [Halioxenophilus aromaticivorans]
MRHQLCVLRVVLACLCLFVAGLAKAFVEIEVYDANDGSLLARVGSQHQTVPFRESLLIKVIPDASANKIRLEPLNSDCGTERIMVAKGPFEFLVHPLSEASDCALQFVGWKAPWNWVGSHTVAISFSGEAGLAQPAVPENFARLELYDLDTNTYLGTVENGVAAIPYAEVIGVSVATPAGLDWVRLVPGNEYCGKQSRFDTQLPFQLKVFAESENRPCEFIVQGYKNPRSLVGATPVSIIFNNEAVTSGR